MFDGVPKTSLAPDVDVAVAGVDVAGAGVDIVLLPVFDVVLLCPGLEVICDGDQSPPADINLPLVPALPDSNVDGIPAPREADNILLGPAWGRGCAGLGANMSGEPPLEHLVL